ncbi:MAG: dihydrolipoyl dehydrogenase [Oligoflexales bacterium]
MSEEFDVVVIGGGPGGYVAAIRAAQLGLKTACIEFRGSLGGTCLNVGCIPSKALLQSSEAYHHAHGVAKDLGVVYDKVSFDLDKILKRKEDIVGNLCGGIEGLFKKNKVTYFKGVGSFVAKNQVKITADGGKAQEITAKNIIIATGSAPIELKTAPFDEKTIVSSTGALSFPKVPEHLVVVGGGVIGLEMGSVWARLGSKVTVIEAMENILFGWDQDVVRTMTKAMKALKMELHEKSKFLGAKKKGQKLVVTLETQGKQSEIECDKLMVSVGRRPYTDGLDLAKAGLSADDRGRVEINDHFETKVPGIYAIGDVVRGPMLAHKAEEEGAACAEIIAGKPGHVNYKAIPNVIYTSPEVASVGLTEAQCKAENLKVKIGKFPFSANGRAKCAGETDGFVKVIADETTDELLGVHIVGLHASEMIGEIAVAFEYRASSEDIARSVHAHPTLTEAIKEACLAVEKRAIHF